MLYWKENRYPTRKTEKMIIMKKGEGKMAVKLEAYYRQDGFTVELSETGKRIERRSNGSISSKNNRSIEGQSKRPEEGQSNGSTQSQSKSSMEDGEKSSLENQNEQQIWYQRFTADKYLALYQMGFLARVSFLSPSIEYLHRISVLMMRHISSSPDVELVREDLEVSPNADEVETLIQEVPFVNGGEFVNREWILELWGKLFSCFQKEIKEYDGTVAAYFAENNAELTVAGRVFFHLVESREEQYPFAFMATYSTRPVKSKKAIHTPLQHALLEFKDDQPKLLSLLSAVGRASEGSSLISGLMDSGELFSPIRFTSEEAYTFLKELPLYEAAGIMCRVPDWWRRHTNSVGLSVTIGEKKQSAVGLDALLDFTPKLMVDGEQITEKQLNEYLSMAEGLVLYKGKWVEINKEKLEAALEAFHKAKASAESGSLTLAEAMRMELGLASLVRDQSETEIKVSKGGWYQELQQMMRKPAVIKPIAVEPTFHATLRGYQEEGFRWLDMMASLGFGACLADDMGLGKTVQVIAWLEHYRLSRGGRVLLVVPASLLGNWQKEIQRFAPQMPYQILHKSAAKAGTDQTGFVPEEGTFLCITTYGMAARLKELTETKWDALILDEAQAIKNGGTKQTKAVKAIPSRARVAMTGTPIENNLGDLWSLFDFLNQGLLGTAKEFDGLVKQITKEESGYGRLKNAVGPFILRRLKTDKSIISDLPDKLEIPEYALLSKKQESLYRKLLTDIKRKLENADGIGRKGLVLASIMKFKQICNHPDQYLGMDEFKMEASGKFQSLEQIGGTIRDKRERLLVFTQFREMTQPLANFLETVFGRPGLVLHGGTTVKQRSELVEQFNGEAYVPFMVLSLKAGGVGLNLTAANHVVHFDRWWNPAVENQATDRAYRIGQTKNVMVYKFVTQGTVEEKIDQMIAEKQKLAGDILEQTGEQWITELDNEQLMELFKLGGEI